MSDQTDETAIVEEEKFNGTAMLTVLVPADTEVRVVKDLAKRYFEDNHGTRPSRVVAEEGDMVIGRWEVAVSDHSSGSLLDSSEYEL
jgi:subtilisin-like proprotein convertase family protein